MNRFAFAVLTAAIIFFVWLSLDFGFFQDDAYISFRYVQNYLDGHGLVFNFGERVEGYTNFGWVSYLLAWGVLGADYLAVSRYTGILLSVWTIIVATLLVWRHSKKEDRIFALLVPTALASCLSLAYWSQTGLETAAFAFVVMLAVYWHVTRNRLLAFALVLAVLIRPEGALLTALLIVSEAVAERSRPSFSLSAGILAFGFSLPLVVFKLFYYGSILPNPFFAKTGFDIAQVSSGWEYALRFFGHYPYAAVPLLGIPFLWRRIGRSGRLLWSVSLLYTIYVIVVGGDVLKVHRFFVPVIGLFATTLVIFAQQVTSGLRAQRKALILFVLLLVVVSSNWYLPRDFVRSYAKREKALTHKLDYLARQMKATDPTYFSVATTTIGSFSYVLMGHRVIDMLGLTDSTVARHPELPIEGIESTWKERSYNSRYILERAPDYIVFSTGLKPSAPAERALFLYPQFLDGYRSITYGYQPPFEGSQYGYIPLFRKTHPMSPPYEPTLSAEWVNYYNMGINANSSGQYTEANDYYMQALRSGSDPPYVYLLYKISLNLYRLKQFEAGIKLQNELIARDSTVSEVQYDQYMREFALGNMEKALAHRRWVALTTPWQLRAADSTALASAERLRNRLQPDSGK